MNKISRRRFLKKSALAGASLFGPIFEPVIEHASALADDAAPGLALPPFFGVPLPDRFRLNLMAGAQPLDGVLAYRRADGDSYGWRFSSPIRLAPFTPKEIAMGGLTPGTPYEYRIASGTGSDPRARILWEDRFTTMAATPSGFSFALFSDAHITPFDRDRRNVLNAVTQTVAAAEPDFGVMLGDNIQTLASHGGPLSKEGEGPWLYAQLRLSLGRIPARVPLLSLNGNWEGENGWHPAEARKWAGQARKAFIPCPDAQSFDEGGSPDGDYYAFTRGEVLCVMLNVTGYTRTDHSLGSTIGRPDDWTLGEPQKAWLQNTLANSNAGYKLIFIHHTVGGNGGDDTNSRYGRGGGRAAKVGEQAQIHSWMKKYGVQALFYGHDHVFTDIPVDGIHYICVGSAGAPWKFDTSVTGYTDYIPDSGYTRVSVSPETLKVEFITPSDKPTGRVLRTIGIPATRN